MHKRSSAVRFPALVKDYPLRIKSFPTGTWEVIWYGEVRYRDRGRPLFPAIDCAVAAVARYRMSSRTVTVQFSLISMIPLGSLWTDGICDAELLDDETDRLEFSVLPRAVRLARAGQFLSGESGEHLLDFKQFDLHRGDTGAFCLRIDLPGKPIVVVPVVEVLRFYFGTTSDLLKRIVTGQTAKLWRSSNVDETGTAFLDLRDGVVIASVAQIARIAFNEDAREAAALVEKSLTAASANGTKLYPKTRFPFSMPATLRGAGILIEPEAGPRRFVVMQIEQCSAKYPFESLTYTGGSEPAERRRRHAVMNDDAGRLSSNASDDSRR